jgi:hypothetical protein
VSRFLDKLGIGPRGAPHSLRWVVLAATVAVAAVFVRAGLPKIADPAGFALAVYRYQMLPDSWVNLTALYLPWLEVVAAVVLLLIPRLRGAAALLILGLLLLFTTLIAVNLYRGIDVACGCFSVDPEVGHFGWLLIVRNAALMAATALALWGARQPGRGA